MSTYNPMSKKFQEEAKRFGLTGNQLVKKYVEEGKLPNPTFIDREHNERTHKGAGFENRYKYQKNLLSNKGISFLEYRNHLAIDRGYDNDAEIQRLQSWNRGDSVPMHDNEECSYYLGVEIAERKVGRKYLPMILGNIDKEMPPNYPGFDFLLVGDIKVIKSSCLEYIYREKVSHLCDIYDDIYSRYVFSIKYNDIADYFFLIGFDDRLQLNILHIWIIRREKIIRGREFCRRDTLVITNKPKKLSEFEIYEVTDKLKNFMIDLKED